MLHRATLSCTMQTTPTLMIPLLVTAAAACSSPGASRSVSAAPERASVGSARIAVRERPTDSLDYVDVTERLLVPRPPQNTQPLSKEEEEQRYREAIAAYEEGDLSRVIDLLQTNPKWGARLLFNLGMVAEQLGEFGKAHAYLQAYLDRLGPELSGERKAAVQKELRELEPRTGWLAIRCDAGIAKVLLDGDVEVTSEGACPLQRRIRVTSGARRIAATSGTNPNAVVARVQVPPEETVAVDISTR
jgi:hypothetical protein